MNANKSTRGAQRPPEGRGAPERPGQAPAPDIDQLLTEARLPGPRRDLLGRGHVAFRRYLTAEIIMAHVTSQALGLAAADFFGLNIVSLRGPVTAGDLAQATGLTSGATTRMIDRLEAAGFVRRVHDTSDRRRVLVEVATDRLAEIDAVLEPNRRRMAEVFLRYTDHELNVLFDYFERATPALIAAASELQARG
jgi:DNA-binding MarR family transcriptional regulator